MAQHYSPRLVTDNLVMCLDPSQNKSYPTTDLPVKDQLNLWLDSADDTVFSYSSGTTVSQWRDKSGQNNHAVVGGGSPLRSVAINSRKAVSFTSNSWFRCTTGSFTSTATHFVVCRATSSSTTYQRVYNGGANTDYYVFIGGLTNSIATFWGSGPSVWFDVNANSPSTTILNTLRIISAVNNGSTATPYYDGTAMSTKTTTNSAGYTGYELNSYGGGFTGQPLVGEVCEIIVYNKQLSATELKQVHTYLGQKWGILNTDRSIIDLSGFNDNGLLGNGTTANMPVYDHDNKSLRFDGANDYVFLANNQLNISSAITVEAWVKYNAQGGYNARSYSVITCKGYPWTWLLEDQGGQFNFRISTSVTADSNVNSSYSHGLNTWDHVVGTYDGATQRIYVDGALRASTSLTGTINTSSNDALVGSYNYGDYCLTGNIGAVRVYSRALSAAEILQNYEAQKSKFIQTLIQQGMTLNLDASNPYSYGGAGTTWYDVSGNNYNHSLNNSSLTVVDNVPCFNVSSANSYIVDAGSTFTLGSSHTLIAWARPLADSQVSTWRTLWRTLPDDHPLLIQDGTNTIGYFDNNSAGFVSYGLNAGTLGIENKWTMFTIVGSGGSSTLYINDGTASGSVAYSAAGLTHDSIGSTNGGTQAFGYVSAAYVYANQALSLSQIQQNYNATKGRFGL